MSAKISFLFHAPDATVEPTSTVQDEVVEERPQDVRYDAPMTDLTRQQVTDMLTASEAKVEARLANFDTSVKTGFADLRTEFAGVRADMAKQNGDFRADMAKLQAEVHKNTADLIKWAIGLAVAIVGMTVGLLTFINKSAEKPAPPAVQASAPAPTIIAVPPGSSVLSAPQAPAAAAPPPAK